MVRFLCEFAGCKPLFAWCKRAFAGVITPVCTRKRRGEESRGEENRREVLNQLLSALGGRSNGSLTVELQGGPLEVLRGSAPRPRRRFCFWNRGMC